MTKMGHIIVERREVGILVDADMSHALILQGAEHFRKAQYYHEMGEVTAASYQISCWHDCECWIALISGTGQPPPPLPKQSQFYFDGKNEAPQKEISEFDMLLSQLRESYPQRFARYLISISSNYRKACDLFYMGKITKAQVQLYMGWQMHKAMLHCTLPIIILAMATMSHPMQRLYHANLSRELILQQAACLCRRVINDSFI